MPPGTGCHLSRPQAEKPDNLVARRAVDQHGVVSLGELRACGLSGDEVATRVRNGWLHRVHRGVYAVGHPGLTLKGRFLAAVKACGPEAVLSHFAAAVLWGIFPWSERLIEVTIADTTPRRHAGLRIHRTRALDPPDIRRREGIPVTSPARTLLDLSARLPEKPLRNAVRCAQGVHCVNVRQLAEVLGRLAPRPGSARLAAIIATGPAPTRSELENVVLDAILAAGIEHPDVNVPLRLDGRRVIPDFRWPARRLVLEADGARWHDPVADAERQALLEAHGERVERITWAEAVTRPGLIPERLA